MKRLKSSIGDPKVWVYLLGLNISSVTGIKDSSFHGNLSRSFWAPGTSEAIIEHIFERNAMAECPLSFASHSLEPEPLTKLWARSVAMGNTCKPEAGTAVMTCSKICWTMLFKKYRVAVTKKETIIQSKLSLQPLL